MNVGTKGSRTDILIRTLLPCSFLSWKASWHKKCTVTFPHSIPRCHQTLSASVVDMRNIHFDTLWAKRSSSLCVRALFVLTEWNMLQRICLLLCVYVCLCVCTVYPTQGRHTQKHLHRLFLYVNQKKILCVGWCENWKGRAHTCVLVFMQANQPKSLLCLKLGS